MFLIGLFLVFLGLKLSGNIDWHWLIVMLPIVIYLARALFVEVFKVCLDNNVEWAVNFKKWLKK